MIISGPRKTRRETLNRGDPKRPVVVAVLRFEVADGLHILISHYIDRQCWLILPRNRGESLHLSPFFIICPRDPHVGDIVVISQFTVFTFCPTYNHLYLKVS